MSHNILENDVQVGTEMAWHGLTQVVPVITAENAGILYGMEFQPSYIQTGTKKFLTLPSGKKKSEKIEIPIFSRGMGKQLVCSDGVVIGSTNDSFELISHKQIWEAIHDGIKGTKHKVVSCLTVQNRQIGAISVDLGEFKAGKEKHLSTLNLIWGNTGKMRLVAKLGTTRTVCNNTINVALGETGEMLASIAHTKNKAKAIDDLGEVIAKAVGVRAEFQRVIDEMAETELSESNARNLFAGFVAPSGESKLSTRAGNTVNRLAELFKGGAGNDGKTRNDAFSAITDFYSHESSGGDNRWKQFVSSEFGAGATAKDRAFELFQNEPLFGKVVERGAQLLTTAG